MAKLSVIVPVYNLEHKGLNKCLDSLVNQTFKDIEIIIINDGSTDNSQKIIDDYKQKYNNIVSYTKENGGQSIARNYGLTKATGEYISFVDGDDYLELDAYEKIQKGIDLKKDIILFDYKLVFSDREEYVNAYNCENLDNVSCKEYLLSNTVACWNKIYKRDFLKKCNFSFPTNIIYEDYAVIPTLVLNNPSIIYVKDAIYNYVQSEESTVRTKEYSKKYEDIFEATDYLYNKVQGSKYNQEFEHIICFHNLFLTAYTFYKYGKYNMIDKVADSIKEKYPNWDKNIYLKKLSPKQRKFMKIFYNKKYNTLLRLQKIKKKLLFKK